MNFIVKFFHDIRNPHCPHCADEIDPLVEQLRTEVTSLRYERDRLLNYILDDPSATNALNKVEEEPEVIQPKVVPWNVRRQMLEAEDREKARILKQTKKEQDEAILELERKTGIIENVVLQVGDADVQSESIEVNDGTHQQYGKG